LSQLAPESDLHHQSKAFGTDQSALPQILYIATDERHCERAMAVFV
jgi:hypothetical protein